MSEPEPEQAPPPKATPKHRIAVSRVATLDRVAVSGRKKGIIYIK